MAFNFFQKISRAIAGKSRVDDDTLDNIEEALIESDMGVDTTLKIIDNLETGWPATRSSPLTNW